MKWIIAKKLAKSIPTKSTDPRPARRMARIGSISSPQLWMNFGVGRGRDNCLVDLLYNMLLNIICICFFFAI
jgi:hypothetical protein